MFEAIIRWLNRGKLSKDKARIRLQHILVIDRTGVSPEILDALRDDMFAIINKYFDIQLDEVEMKLEKDDESVALIANIPIVRSKREFERQKQPTTSE
ncbi:cell division topological specificity factor MinE [Candidatus Poribacteria bacterium]|nr:cell division topological specificity factor MinE [Candidatus Poribacteria bacterium]